MKTFALPNFQGECRVFYGNDHIIHISKDNEFKSMILSKYNKELVLCIKLILNDKI